jgi:FlaA1/EpsC-like NDP-sugar epimerase
MITKTNALIFGAGGAGKELLKEFANKNRSYRFNIIGFIDDDVEKYGLLIKGVQVLGKSNNLSSIIKDFNIDIVFIAIPSSSGKLIRKIFLTCAKLSVIVKLVPRISEIINGQVTFDQVKNIEVEDVLGRSVIRQDFMESKDKMTKKTTIIFGASGSIGSELSKQCLLLNPEKIICVDQWENGLFYLGEKLSKVQVENCFETDIVYEITDIRDKRKIDFLFEKYKPDYVFNAAAYKHVPLMESNIDEAIKNNILGTKILCEAALKNRVKNFVLISTDKAVNPTNVMGATKRVTEKLMHCYSNQVTKTKFSAVRFGNVLNSNGSVIPTFKKQLDEGQITVTHPDIIRYFMTINEAVQLILQCWAQSLGDEIFILDMGEPIKILDLAKLMIRLRGLEPYKDIDIKFVGLRPGEKLYEELLTGVEKTNVTKNDKIFVLKEDEKFNHAIFMRKINKLIESCNKNNPVELKQKLKEVVKTYVETDYVFK